MTEQLMEDLTNEEHEALLLMSEHAIAAPLSPAAQAVLDAAMQYEINPECYSREIAAAALRAAVEIYSEEGNGEGPQWFLAIATELENTHG